MTIEEQLQTLNISEVERVILDAAVENYSTHCHFAQKDSFEAKKFYDHYLEDLDLLEKLRPFINWINIVYDLKRQNED